MKARAVRLVEDHRGEYALLTDAAAVVGMQLGVGKESVLTYMTGIMVRNKYRCVVVTPEAIHVLDSTKSSGGAKPQAVAGQIPRNTRLGPASGRWAEIYLLGERHWVHKRFHDQIAAADRDAGF